MRSRLYGQGRTVTDFTREMDRLRMEARTSLSGQRHELAAVRREIDKYLDAIAAGVPGGQVKDRMIESSWPAEKRS